MKTFFAQQEVNTGRQIELDLLKSFTIICCLIGAHICDEFIFDFDNSLVWTQSYVFGRVLGAPIFMFSMGFTMMYTTHHTAGDMFWRAIKLLTFGQTLNIFRYAIPYYWGAQLDPAYYNPQQVLNFSSDILQLAGLAFIVMAITRALKLSTALTLLIAIGMSLLGTFLTGVETNNYMVNQALGLLWPTHTESYYPLFNWFIFIAGGQWMGSIYRHINNKKAQESRCWTEKLGVNQCMIAAKNAVLDKFGVKIEESTVEQILRFGTADISAPYMDCISSIARQYVAELFSTLRKYEYNPDLMHLYVVGGGGCLIRNFGTYDKLRVTIIDDICATAKGYESLAYMSLKRRG